MIVEADVWSQGIPGHMSLYKYPQGGARHTQYSECFPFSQFSHSVMSDSAIPGTETRQTSLFTTNSQNLLKFISIELVMPSNHLILCHPLLLPPSISPSIRVFSNQSVLPIRWPKYWSFRSASVLSMNIQDWFPSGLTGLIFLQSKGLSRVFSNTTVQKHPFFSAQFSLWSNSHMHPWLLGKTIALTRWILFSAF